MFKIYTCKKLKVANKQIIRKNMNYKDWSK